MNLVEKLLAGGAGVDRVEAGELVWASIDLACIDDVQFPVFFPVFERLGGTIWDRSRVALVADHYLPPSTPEQAETVGEMRRFAAAHDLPHGFFSEGIKHQVLPAAGLVRPGSIVAATDSHSNTMGAFGAFATALGPTEMAAVFTSGRMWFKVPETIHIELAGELADGVYAKDVALRLLAENGVSFARYRALEFGGDLAERLPVGERIALCNMSTEMGAKAAIFPPDAASAAYCGIAWPQSDEHGWRPDPGASYARRIRIDVTDLEPLVALPSSPANVVPATRAAGLKIHQAFIGSCCNANVEDLTAAARILAGRRVHPRVVCIVTPASRAVYEACLRAGVVQTLLEAGCIVTNPGCGACPGIHMGTLGPGEVRVSSQNRNFVGRGGHPDASIVLASAATVAASAIAGEVVDPRAFL